MIGTSAVIALGGTSLLASPAAAADSEYDKHKKAIDEAQKKQREIRTGRPSANGWEMENATDKGGSVWTRPVPATEFDIATRIGEVEAVLVHVVQRFHYEIDTLRAGDVIGWQDPNQVNTKLPESNQASGTAVAIRPGSYPPGVRGGFFPHEKIVVRDILAELGGVVRWGGDDTKPYEALFYIDVPPDDHRLANIAADVQSSRKEPGSGAGTPGRVTSD
ncbi:hypothetical protein CDO52_21065 [Nocardiopsis gilva YIM 90087]|uniref:Uncharacterized protein n=1 Tax=Nocardiopsis gilva YIM 90087 TaxID=1235441 RepID=A0A223SA34_9ACTN|nr:hypothetical protein CDO52_21065 [Nocardiopsis gilva YIM 90087]